MFDGLFAALEQSMAFPRQIIDLRPIANGVVLQTSGLTHTLQMFILLAPHLLAQRFLTTIPLSYLLFKPLNLPALHGRIGLGALHFTVRGKRGPAQRAGVPCRLGQAPPCV